MRAFPANRCHPRTFFSLMEILVVLAILGLITGLVLPRIGKLPEGLRVDTCVGVFSNALRDAALRSRATGATVRLVLDAENNAFRLEESFVAPLLPGQQDDVVSGHYTGGKSYPLPNGIEWRLDEGDAVPAGGPAYTFYPNGECTGPRLEFSTGTRHLRLEVDRLTAAPLVTDLAAPAGTPPLRD